MTGLRFSRSRLPGRLRTLVFFASVGVALFGLADRAFATITDLVPRESSWKFLDDGSDQGSAWRAPAFDDDSWDEGPAKLGYGDSNVVTTLSYGSDAGAKHIAYWFRHAFDVADPSLFAGLLLDLVRDDGAVVYLNGVEVARSNMPEGAIDFTTRAEGSVSNSAEGTVHSFLVDAAHLVVGENLLAVEVHQSSASSSDVGFDLELRGSDGEARLVREPYLQSSSSSSVVLRWRTDFPSTSRVWYGAAPGSLLLFEDGVGETTEHEVGIYGLDASTTYYYAVGTDSDVLAGDNAEHFFKTTPDSGEAADLRFWVLGDSGTANSSAAAVRDAYRGFTDERAADLMVMLGDNAYDTGTDPEYQAAVFDMYTEELRTIPLWPALGNHDAGSADSPTQSGVYYDIFSLPRNAEAGGVASLTEAYYSFDYGDVHFVCLDSHDTDRSVDSEMLEWLAADLATTTARWVIAFWHHPPYTDGSHDSDDETRLIQMRENAVPLLEAAGVDLVLAGHSHSYERSALLDGHYGSSDTLLSSMILDAGDGDPSGDGAYRKPSTRASNAGAIYAVAGSSGKTSSAPLSHPAMFIALQELGSLVVDISGDTMDVHFIETSGMAGDHFQIHKGGRCGDGFLDAGEDCDDGNLVDGDCCPATCSFPSGCFDAGKAVVKIKHSDDAASRDRLLWKWNKGAAFAAGVMGDPVVASASRVCLYDYQAGGVDSLTRFEIPSGASWSDRGEAGWLYRDSDGNAAGITQVRVKSGEEGRTQVFVRGKAENLALPSAVSEDAYLHQSPAVLLQFSSDSGACWSARFDAADGAKMRSDSFKDVLR